MKIVVPYVIRYDFDNVGVPTNASTVWRQESMEYWIRNVILDSMRGVYGSVAFKDRFRRSG